MHRYRISLDTQTDVINFVAAACKQPHAVHLVSGSGDFTVSGKSVLGVLYARAEWDKLYAQCEAPIFSAIADFVVDDT